MNTLFKDFNESKYLTQNTDVSEAVKNGHFSSGLEHYISFGFHENRLGVTPEAYESIKEFMKYGFTESFPPEHLMKRAHGDESMESFGRSGRNIFFNIYSAISPVIDFHKKHHRILDFGCGCGRIIRYFHKLSDNNNFYGTDIDDETISWCKQSLHQIGEFHTNPVTPPLPFEDEYFDFIYSISVFTHLPEDMQFMWLEELRRVSKPGGYLLLTTHGEELFGESSKKQKKQLRKKGFYFAVNDGTDGLPDFYQTSFHTEKYINSRWSKFFEIKKIIKKGIANNQDLILCRRPD